MSKSFLIIGGSSDIAMSVTELLLSDGHKVTMLVRDISRVEELKSKGVKLFKEMP